MPTNNIAVIGSGFGGLATAIRLQAAGFNVHIFEKRDLAGGRAYVYQDKGFTFDAGPTVITAPECLEDLFSLAGTNIENYVDLLPVYPFYKLLWDDGYQFNYSDRGDELESQIKEKAPKDYPGYLKFLKYSEKVFEEGYTKLADKPFLKFWDMVKVAPQLATLRADRSVYKTVSKFIKDDHLREAFSFHSLLVGGNPFDTSSIYTLIHYLERNWGVTFPKGGTGALIQGLVKLFKDLGGAISYNEPVEKVLTENNRVVGVRTQSGQIYPCTAAVSNADVYHTYKHLLKDEPVLEKTRRKLEKSRYSMSLFLIYFGTNRKYENLAHHNVLFGPRYKGLLDDIFKNGVLPEDFSLYLHRPSATDPQMAPEGCDAFYVLAPVAHKGHLDVDWSKEGPIYADKIMTYMQDKYMPGLKDSVVTQRIFTPDDFETELNSHLGAAFSLEPTLTQSAYFRTHNRDDKISNLYFSGAGTHPGAGIPGVVNSGKATADLLISDLGSQLLPRVVPENMTFQPITEPGLRI